MHQMKPSSHLNMLWAAGYVETLSMLICLNLVLFHKNLISWCSFFDNLFLSCSLSLSSYHHFFGAFSAFLLVILSFFGAVVLIPYYEVIVYMCC